eukprot:1157304-Pelagomonas_calceolata.AAC.2
MHGGLATRGLLEMRGLEEVCKPLSPFALACPRAALHKLAIFFCILVNTIPLGYLPTARSRVTI